MAKISQILKQKRESLGLTIKDVSDKLKIRIHILEDFENGNFSDLPSVYAKSFLKTYSSYLKIDLAQFDDELLEIFGKEKKAEFKPLTHLDDGKKGAYISSVQNFKSDSLSEFISKIKSKLDALQTSKNKNINNYLLYIALILGVLVLLYFSFFSDTSDNQLSVYKPGDDINTGSDTAELSSENKGLLSFFQNADSLVLQAKANDTAWIRIDIDGRYNEVFLMEPKHTKQWTAEEYFIMTIGNAGSVEFTMNGKKIPIMGAKGTVVRNVKITRDTVVNASSPWSDSTARKKRKRELAEPPKPKLIEPSDIDTRKPFQNLTKPKRDSTEI